MAIQIKTSLIGWVVLIFMTCPSYIKAQTPADAMEKIRSNASEYKIGEASAPTEDEARKASLQNLIMNLRTTLMFERRDKEKMKGDQYDLESVSNMCASSVATIENLNTLAFEDKNGWHAMSYVSTRDFEESERQRIGNIKDLVELGIQQEQNLNIAGALKYYTWALNMLSSFGDTISMTIEGKTVNAKAWLSNHVPMVLDNIEIGLSDEKIDFDEFDYDHYSVNLNLKYAGRPVSALDLGYFNGEREVRPVHGKSGRATLSFPDLQSFREISVKVVYDYPDEARLYDPALKAVYDSGVRVRFDGRDNVRLPIKVHANNLKSSGPSHNDEVMALAKRNKKEPGVAADMANTSTSPIIKEERKQIERPVVEDRELADAMKIVEEGLRKRNYTSLESLFTPEGWKLFSLLVESGSVKVTSTPASYSIESSDLFTIGRGIPIAFKTSGHVSNETLVFRFDKDSGLISSVAFALTKRAEDDIFRQAQWNMESRYSLLTFMEDYQTAFALKRLDYIEKIFSDDAIIITGKMGVPAKNSKLFFDAKQLNLGQNNKNVNFTRYSKSEYINKLKQDFYDRRSATYKKYIQLVFEDAVISKVATNGYTDNEIMWIEIKQQYNSDKYSDKGFLALQIDLKPKGSQIRVRTWTPDFIDINYLKERFGIGASD